MLGRRWFSPDGGDVLTSVIATLLREGAMVACFLYSVNTKQEGTTCQSGSSSSTPNLLLLKLRLLNL